jgi:hypothetical protein
MDIRQILEDTNFYPNLTAALLACSLDKLDNPALNLQIFIQEGNSADGERSDTFEANEQPVMQSGHLLSVGRLIDYETISWHENHTGRETYTDESCRSIKSLFALARPRAASILLVLALTRERHLQSTVYQPIGDASKFKEVPRVIRLIRGTEV